MAGRKLGAGPQADQPRAPQESLKLQAGEVAADERTARSRPSADADELLLNGLDGFVTGDTRLTAIQKAGPSQPSRRGTDATAGL